MSVTPDIEGFADAQKRLREHFAETITFLEHRVSDWPAGTPIDPETQRPYDPVVEADSTTRPEHVVECNVVFKAINRAGVSGETDAGPLGWNDTSHVMLIADISDEETITGCEDFILREEVYKITATKPDGIGSVQRLLIYGRKR